jgi:hypothetical protein
MYIDWHMSVHHQGKQQRHISTNTSKCSNKTCYTVPLWMLHWLSSGPEQDTKVQPT